MLKNPKQQNQTGYVWGNPHKWPDPLGLEPGDSYPTADDAAEAGINDIRDKPDSDQNEYAGRVYQNPDGTYSYTEPNKGSDNESDPGGIPDNTTGEGAYHTHPGTGEDPEAFSIEDVGYAITHQEPVYLGTPSDKIKKYTPPKDDIPSKIQRGKVKTLRQKGVNETCK